MGLTRWRTEKDPRQRSPLSPWTGRAMGKDWPERPADRQLQEPQKKTVIGPWLLRWRQSVSLHTWHHQGPCKPSSCAPFTLNSHWGRAAIGQKKSVHTHRVILVQSNSLCPCRLCPARLVCQGFSRQEYWSVLANTGCHTLLEYWISCCSGHQLPWVPGAARTPENQAAAAPPQLALTGATQVLQGSLRCKPLWMTHRQWWEKKKTKHSWNPGGSVAKEDPKLSHQLYKLWIKSMWSTRPTLPRHYIKGHWEHPLRKMQSFWELWTFKARTHKRRTRFKSEQIPHLVQRSA